MTNTLSSKSPLVRWLVCSCSAAAFGCTFYTNCADTGCPDDPGYRPPGAAGGANVTGGTGGTAGTGMPGGSGKPGDMGVVSGDPPDGEWVNATANLEGIESGCGSVHLVSAKPNEDLVIAGLPGHGLFASSDGGESWSAIGQGRESEEIANRPTNIVYDPSDPDVFWEAGIYGTYGGYRTDDDGDTFARLGNLFHVDLVTIDFSDPERKTMLSQVHESPRFLRSDDAGQTWAEITDSLPGDTAAYCRRPVIVDTDTFMLGCHSVEEDLTPGILRTTDAGRNWSFASELPASPSMLLASDGTLYWIGEKGALLRSDDSGETWQQVAPDNTLSTSFDPVELDDGGIGAMSPPYLVVSSDRGETWQRASPVLPFTPMGYTYSPVRNAFYIWHSDCSNPLVLPDAILRFDR